MGIGRDLTEIATFLISVSLMTLLIKNASGTSTVVGAVTGGFANLLSTADGSNYGATNGNYGYTGA